MTELETAPARRPEPARRPGDVRNAKPPRRPAVALAGTILFGLLAAFFAWQAAEPLWLALGQGETGTATVTRCQASEQVSYRCVVFQADGGAYQVTDVTLRGAGDALATEGAQVPARMLSASHERAYAASPAGLHLRWAAAVALVVVCGLAIAWVSGATRLDDRRSRRRAVLLSVAAPLLLTLGFLTAAL